MTISQPGADGSLASAATRRSHMWVGLSFLAVTAFGAIGTVMVETGDFGSDPGPVSYPAFVLALMGLCGVLQLLSRDRSAVEHGQSTKDRGMLLRITAALLVYVVILGLLGYIASTVVFIFTALLIAGERRRTILAAYSILVPFAVHYLFSEVFGIVLPSGIVEGIL